MNQPIRLKKTMSATIAPLSRARHLMKEYLAHLLYQVRAFPNNASIRLHAFSACASL